MAIYELNRADIRRDIARLMGLLLVTGKATAGLAGSLDDTNNLIHATDKDLEGKWVIIFKGTSSGDIRLIDAFTAATDRIAVIPNWTTAPTTSSEYDIYDVLRPEDFNQAIREAIRVANMNGVYVDRVDETLVENDLLMGDGMMERWPDGVVAGNMPANFTASAAGTFIQDKTDFTEGLASLKITSDGTLASKATYTIKDYTRWAGKSLTLFADIWADTASRVDLLIDDGIGTSNSTDHAGGSKFEYGLTVTRTIDSKPKKLVIELRISSGAAVVAFFDNVQLRVPELWEYDISTRLNDTSGRRFSWLYQVYKEASVGARDFDWGDWFYPRSQRPVNVLRRDEWDVIRFGTPKLVFTPVRHSLTTGARLRLVGQGGVDDPTTDTTTIKLDPEYVKNFAAWRLTTDGRIREIIKMDVETRRDLERAWRSMLQAMRTNVYPGSKLVEPI